MSENQISEKEKVEPIQIEAGEGKTEDYLEANDDLSFQHLKHINVVPLHDECPPCNTIPYRQYVYISFYPKNSSMHYRPKHPKCLLQYPPNPSSVLYSKASSHPRILLLLLQPLSPSQQPYPHYSSHFPPPHSPSRSQLQLSYHL